MLVAIKVIERKGLSSANTTVHFTHPACRGAVVSDWSADSSEVVAIFDDRNGHTQMRSPEQRPREIASTLRVRHFADMLRETAPKPSHRCQRMAECNPAELVAKLRAAQQPKTAGCTTAPEFSRPEWLAVQVGAIARSRKPTFGVRAALIAVLALGERALTTKRTNAGLTARQRLNAAGEVQETHARTVLHCLACSFIDPTHEVLFSPFASQVRGLCGKTQPLRIQDCPRYRVCPSCVVYY